MTVRELIEILKRLPQDDEVFARDREGLLQNLELDTDADEGKVIAVDYGNISSISDIQPERLAVQS